MAQPAKGQEPSMEEILASIRRIIADEPAKAARSEVSRSEASRSEASRQEMSRPDRDALSRNEGPRRDGQRSESPRIEPLRSEGPRSEGPSYQSSRHEIPIRSIARSQDAPQPRGPLLPQPPARVAPLSSSARAARSPAPDPETRQGEIDTMLAALNAGLRQGPQPAALEPAQEPASEPESEPAQEPESDIFELTEQMAAAQSLPAAELTFPDNFAQESYEEESSTEAREEHHPDAVAQAAAEPLRPMRDHLRDVDRANERDSYRDTSEDGLVSAATTAAVDSAFNALAQTVLVQNGRTLEDLVREMLRPMLKIWLDDNLPSMVERLVRAEIERVSRGR
jgi:cell pole-organizing protein PopZ